MKYSILALAILLLTYTVSSKPTASHGEENLLNTFLALQQDYGDDTVAIEQDDDGDGDALIQHENDEEPGKESSIVVQVQKLAKLQGNTQLVVLAKLQALEKQASDKAEAQWWHHVLHWAWHIFHHHYRHHYRHHHG